MTARPVCVKRFPLPPIDRGEVLRYAGMRGHSEEMEALLSQCIAEAEGVFSNRVCWRVLPVTQIGDEWDLTLARVRSASLDRHLAGCRSIVVFAATVGVEIDRLVARANAVSPTRALLLNALGSERVEALCDAFEAETVEATAQDGARLQRRFSPGYGDLPLSLQRDVIAALDCQRSIGLTLNQSLLLSPSKSVTAMIGIP